jgi:hypothetical protein
MRTKRNAARIATVLAFVLATSCATTAPGQDKYVVRAEQTLAAADVVYAEAMRYYFAPGVATSLGKDAVKAFEFARVNFDPAYKEVQRALDTYKLVRSILAIGELRAAQTNLANALNPVAVLTPSKPKAIEVP